MIHVSEVRGAIFDFDDTLLNNGPVDQPELWLHSRSRLAAVHDIAKTHGIRELISLTPEQNGRAFITASSHSLSGAIWNLFYMQELVSDPEIDETSEWFPLISEIAKRKNELHEEILREFGVEVPGAARFVRSLRATYGLYGRMALATAAIRRDIDIFLEKYNLESCFPSENIISHEKITRPKPDPESFELAFQTLGLPDSARRHVLAFEDNPRGVASAKAVGLHVCAITTRVRADDSQLLAAKPDLIADSYDEFAKLLGVSLDHERAT